MSDIRQTLTDVLSGAKPPEAFLTAVDDFLAKPNANIDALRSLIDAAEKNGLPKVTADAARAKLSGDSDLIDIGDPTRAVEEDSDSTVMMTGEDAPTHLRADPADIDRTVFTGDTDSDKTVVTGDNDRTEISGPIDDDKTVATGTGGDDATVQVGGSDDDPFAMTGGAAAAKPDEIGPGTVLKGRFRLEQVIGQGGMGAVYKAVDLLKVEARDRNPYMAVKLLVGDFKEHPEAFIALQRESAKAQRLAHPNIATVYDFDRDGETVYMTMELMVGAELAKYIKKLPAGGLPVPEAVKIIEQLCAGLQYAHARGLVHSDFKPGNAFLLDDGTVKLLDFGIARASKTQADADGEKTVFDPGELGALTPAYATIEMFEGQDPDPRDDIYALAAVSYELFTGKHPFNKMSAVKAKEKNLKPASVEKLTKRQNKALFKALALHRDDRTGSVEEFWEGVKPRKDYTLHIAAGATAAALLLGALLYNPVMNILHEREYAAIVQTMQDDVEAGLAQIDALPSEERRADAAIRAKGVILPYFSERALAAEENLDYPQALVEAQRARGYLNDGDSAELQNDIGNRQREAFSERDRPLQDFLAAVTEADKLPAAQRRARLEAILLPNEAEQDLPELVAELKRISPTDDRLNDSRIALGYAALAGDAADAEQWQRASDILAVAAAAAPRDPRLVDLKDTVSTELRREQENALVASLRQTLQQSRPRTLEEFRAVNEALQQLGQLRPTDTVVRGLDQALQAAISGEIARAAQEGDWAAANAVLAEFARALPLEFLIDTRLALTADQAEAGYSVASDAGRIERRGALRDQIQQMLTDPTFDIEFERALTASFKELTALVDVDTSEWEALRERIATVHVDRALALAEDNLYRQATAAVDQGTRFHADLPAFAETRATLETAERAYEEELAREQERNRIAAAKKNVLDLAEGDDPNVGAAFRTLLPSLESDDPFIAEGTQAVEAAYIRLAAREVANDPAQAVNFLTLGLNALPQSRLLSERRDNYRARASAAAVVTAAGRVSDAGFAAWQRDFTAAREALPANDRAAFERDTVAALVERLRALDRDRIATPVRDKAVPLFSGALRQQLAGLSLREPLPPSRFAPRITTAIQENKLTAARELLVEAQRAESGHPELAGFPATLTRLENEAAAHYRNAQSEQNRSNLTAATQYVDRALAIWADNTEYADLRRRLAGNTGSRRADDGSKPCTASLAGYGRQARGRCHDVVAPNVPAPQLAVVPAPAGGSLFAISRLEVTIEDYNRYCAATGCAALSGADALPATGISIQQIDGYIAWLSEVTGQRYRLPTSAEWTHAANANGNPGSSQQFNCRVMGADGQPQKGRALVNATSSAENAWGLNNAVGNAQELVRDGSTLVARGGSYEVSLTNCSVALAEPHSGAADGLTGFRVIRAVD